MNRDVLIHGMLLDNSLRFAAIDGTKLVSDAKELHDLSRVATAALGRQLMITVIAASLCKNETDTVSTVISGNGPAGNLVCVGRCGRFVKGYAANPHVELPIRPDGKLDVGGAVGVNGHVTVVKDLGLRDPYVGQTRIVSGEIAEDMAFYLTVSEQTPSLVSLGVLVEGKQEVHGAGGVLIQPLPGCSEAVLQQLESLANHLAGISTAIRDLGSAEALAQYALIGFRYNILESIEPAFECDCSRERIERVLLSMGETELRAMMAEQHGAQVSCHFCNEQYNFTETQLEALLAEAKAQ